AAAPRLSGRKPKTPPRPWNQRKARFSCAGSQKKLENQQQNNAGQSQKSHNGGCDKVQLEDDAGEAGQKIQQKQTDKAASRIQQELENQLHGRHENLDEQKDKQNRNSQRDDFLHRSLL